MQQLRPISLCNISYKIVAKVLANRLKKVRPHLISSSQSAFVPDRIIHDNILLAHEVMHFLKTSSNKLNKYMAVKLDMSKAYDRVVWSFVEAVIRKVGFNQQWISWIMDCMKFVNYSVIINGEAKGHITPSRGLRQGDPISPFLLLLCAEALSGLLYKAERECAFTGVKMSRTGPMLSHLFFADDSLLLCKANVVHCDLIKDILQVYGAASRQMLRIVGRCWLLDWVSIVLLLKTSTWVFRLNLGGPKRICFVIFKNVCSKRLVGGRVNSYL